MRPVADELSTEEESARFEELKPRLQEMWDSVLMREEQPHTSVVVPSLSLDQEELKKLPGSSFYEERLLFLLIRLRNPVARMVYVTSQPVHPMILDYYLQFLAGVPESHARRRLTLLCAYDSSPRPLTTKILERPRLIQRIRAGMQDPERAYLTVFNATPLERKLAVLLGIPLNGVDPRLSHLGSKSGSRRIFRQAGADLPAGREDLRTQADLEDALLDLGETRPGMTCAVIKLNDSFAGEGNALFRFPKYAGRAALRESLRKIECSAPAGSAAVYFDEFARMGGVVEEFIDAPEKASPSVQMRVSPRGHLGLISTHDQILGGAIGQRFLGCTFPAREEYRLRIQQEGLRIGEILAAAGVVGRFGVDFVVGRHPGEREWRISPVEINLRMGGTTHPYLALRFLTGGQLDPATGLFHSPGGRVKYYRATDDLHSDAYRGLLPEDLIEILTSNGLHYSPGSETGTLFHLIGAVSEFGTLGLTAIGNSREEVETIYGQAVAVLDRETGGQR